MTLIANLRVTSGIVTAEVEGEPVVFAAPTISPGVWSAVDVNAPNLAQTLEHTWEEPLWPDTLTATGSPEAINALRREIEGNREHLVRWRGYPMDSAIADAWGGHRLPELPPLARRPPNSVPKRLGSAGIAYAGDDVVEALVRIYDEF